jgi:hypothetical protein
VSEAGCTGCTAYGLAAVFVDAALSFQPSRKSSWPFDEALYCKGRIKERNIILLLNLITVSENGRCFRWIVVGRAEAKADCWY